MCNLFQVAEFTSDGFSKSKKKKKGCPVALSISKIVSIFLNLKKFCMGSWSNLNMDEHSQRQSEVDERKTGFLNKFESNKRLMHSLA